MEGVANIEQFNPDPDQDFRIEIGESKRDK